MTRGGGNGGGGGSARAFGIGMKGLEGTEGGDVRKDARELEYRPSKPELRSHTRIEGGDVKRGMSMVGEQEPGFALPQIDPDGLLSALSRSIFVDTSWFWWWRAVR